MALIQVNLGRPAPETYNTQKKQKERKKTCINYLMHKYAWLRFMLISWAVRPAVGPTQYAPGDVSIVH